MSHSTHHHSTDISIQNGAEYTHLISILNDSFSPKKNTAIFVFGSLILLVTGNRQDLFKFLSPNKLNKLHKRIVFF